MIQCVQTSGKGSRRWGPPIGPSTFLNPWMMWKQGADPAEKSVAIEKALQPLRQGVLPKELIELASSMITH